jgi:gamma-glutamylputrescine oxidase
MSDAVLDATTWYRATAGTPPQTTPLDVLPGNADVCVIGAGLTGLSAALELVTAGYSVAVFDTGPIGWGASGRNGGQVCTGYSPGMDSFESQLGPADAKLCFDVAEEGKQLMRERVETHSIDCHLTWGYVHAAARPSHMDGLKQHKEQLEHYGATGLAMLSRDEARARIASDAYHGGLYEADAGHIHVLEYTLGLARAVLAKGGQIFENARVSKVADGQPATLTLDERRHDFVQHCHRCLQRLSGRACAGAEPSRHAGGELRDCDASTWRRSRAEPAAGKRCGIGQQLRGGLFPHH